MASKTPRSEFALIDLLTAGREPALWLRHGAYTGVGDDCAVIPLPSFSGIDLLPGRGGCRSTAASYADGQPRGIQAERERGHSLLVTTDTMVEGRHFDLRYTDARELGWKLLAVNLSDVAAMGGLPRAAVISLGVSPSVGEEFLASLYCGLDELARRYDVEIAGGDTVCTPSLTVGLTLLGLCEGAPLLRAGAQPGDELWVSGKIGAAGLGLACLRAGTVQPTSTNRAADDAVRRYNTPEPRIELGRTLQKARLASAAIDISDGLLQDVGHIAERSGVAMTIDLDLVPVVLPDSFSSEYRLEHALTAGDDYELAFTASPLERTALEELSARHPALAITRIGTVRAVESDGQRLTVLTDGTEVGVDEYLRAVGISRAGYDHFANETDTASEVES